MNEGIKQINHIRKKGFQVLINGFYFESSITMEKYVTNIYMKNEFFDNVNFNESN